MPSFQSATDWLIHPSAGLSGACVFLFFAVVPVFLLNEWPLVKSLWRAFRISPASSAKLQSKSSDQAHYLHLALAGLGSIGEVIGVIFGTASGAWIGAGLLWWAFHDYMKHKHPEYAGIPYFIPRFAAGIVLMVGVFFLLSFMPKSKNDGVGIVSQSTEVYMECQSLFLPITVPSHGVSHVMAFNEKQFLNMKMGFFEIPNTTSKDMLWPDSKLMKASQGDPGMIGYKCEVSNHVSANLIDLAIKITVHFENEKIPHIYTALISPLDGNQTFTFYAINECPPSVSAIAPDTASVQVLGEEKRRVIPLHWARRNPAEQAMLLFGSKTRWTGNSCQ
jgi:hypothetical protein